MDKWKVYASFTCFGPGWENAPTHIPFNPFRFSKESKEKKIKRISTIHCLEAFTKGKIAWTPFSIVMPLSQTMIQQNKVNWRSFISSNVSFDKIQLNLVINTIYVTKKYLLNAPFASSWRKKTLVLNLSLLFVCLKTIACNHNVQKQKIYILCQQWIQLVHWTIRHVIFWRAEKIINLHELSAENIINLHELMQLQALGII